MEPSILYRSQIEAVLRGYVEGKTNAAQVAEWADSVEAREEIDYELSHEQQIADLLFELATPEINGTLTSERAQVLLNELNNAL